ncbi:MAG: cytidylate kinase family protein, partial [archaeon]|nr:cytidylate kinase family protein [archaeon]
TITGFPGTQTKEIGKMLGFETGIKFVSGEEIMKKLGIEENISEEMNEEFSQKLKQLIQAESKAGIITDHPLSPWILHEAEAKIFLNSLEKVRAKRIVEKEKLPISEAMQKIQEEKKKNEQVYLNNFGISVYDFQAFDLTLNIDKLSNDNVVGIIKSFIQKMS